MSDNLDIIIFGASGDLARKKVFPAFFSLFSRGLLPKNVKFYGFARSDMKQEEFIEKITTNLTCRYTPEKSCQEEMNNFLSRCIYVRGDYKQENDYKSLLDKLNSENNNNNVNRLFYFAVPPVLFSPISKCIGSSNLNFSSTDKEWSRVIIEKPFGRDRKSSDQLMGEIGEVFSEEQTYRIDHYLGNEVVQNIMVFRFANILFTPIWNSEYIEKIDISWSENQGIDERGGYFDNYGIIRDVIQNHLFQVLALITMEEPQSLQAKDIRDCKVAVLKNIAPIEKKNLIVGQYSSARMHGVRVSSYLEDPTVPDDSITPTFAHIDFTINNDRWKDMPISITAGKGLSTHKAEITIIFKRNCGNVFCNLNTCPPTNKLVIRIQPDEGFNFVVTNKVPGRKMEFMEKNLDLSYNTAFPDDTLPDAYENLLIDAIIGDKTLFIRNDELEIAWDILTPVLENLEKENLKPMQYPFGSDLKTLIPDNSFIHKGQNRNKSCKKQS